MWITLLSIIVKLPNIIQAVIPTLIAGQKVEVLSQGIGKAQGKKLRLYVSIGLE